MSERLDTPQRVFYMPARLMVVAAALWAAVATAGVVDGVQLPDGATKVGERRYRAGRDFDATLKYFRTVYPPSQYPRSSIVNQPSVRGVHIAFPRGKKYAGLNVYEDKVNVREVRIYLVPR